MTCKGCNQAERRCLCNDTPVIVQKKKKYYSLHDFLKYIGVNSDRNAVRIKIEFKHKRFRDNEGFAVLDLEGDEMRRIVSAIADATISEKKSLGNIINKLIEDEKRD